MVAARGEQRITRGSGAGEPQAFGCSPAEDAGAAPCTDGVLIFSDFNLSPDVIYELRFARSDGSYTPWQRVALEPQKHTDADFNGSGCPCSWYEAEPVSVVVPADARPVNDD